MQNPKALIAHLDNFFVSFTMRQNFSNAITTDIYSKQHKKENMNLKSEVEFKAGIKKVSRSWNYNCILLCI